MKKTKFYFLCLALMLSQICFAGGQMPKLNRGCASDEAQQVEQAVSNVTTWREFEEFYKKRGMCDVSALRYGFTQTITKLTAEDEGLVRLSAMLRKSPYLKEIIVWHLRSEAVSQENANLIAEKISHCKAAEHVLCLQVKRAIGK